MTFNYTNGKSARYMVSVYSWNVSDQYLYHLYKDAKAMFNVLKEKGFEDGTSISIYDIENDVRKNFIRF